VCAYAFRYHRYDRDAREGLATRIGVILIEHRVGFERLMAVMLDRRPGLGVVAQAGFLT
jgi:hypothetical protein